MDPRYKVAEDPSKEEIPPLNMVVIEHMLQLPRLDEDMIIEVT